MIIKNLLSYLSIPVIKFVVKSGTDVRKDLAILSPKGRREKHSPTRASDQKALLERIEIFHTLYAWIQENQIDP